MIMIWYSKNGPIDVKNMDKSHAEKTINFLVNKNGPHLILNLILEAHAARMDKQDSKFLPTNESCEFDIYLDAMEKVNSDIALMNIEQIFHNRFGEDI